MSKLYYFECKDCQYDSSEAERLSTWTEGCCPICAEDNGRDVWMSYRPATEMEVIEHNARNSADPA